MDWLTKAVAAGFKDRNRIEKDKDLIRLRDRIDIQRLMDALPEATPPPRRVQ